MDLSNLNHVHRTVYNLTVLRQAWEGHDEGHTTSRQATGVAEGQWSALYVTDRLAGGHLKVT